MTRRRGTSVKKDVQHIPLKLGERVRLLRKQWGWSQEILGEKAGLHPTYVGGIERGERNVSLLNLARLADAFQVTLAELLSFLPHGDATEKAVQQLIVGNDDMALAFYSTFCNSCSHLNTFRRLRMALPGNRGAADGPSGPTENAS